MLLPQVTIYLIEALQYTQPTDCYIRNHDITIYLIIGSCRLGLIAPSIETIARGKDIQGCGYFVYLRYLVLLQPK